MREPVLSTAEAYMGPVLSYLSPLSFIRLIRSCSYLYKTHQGKIQGMKKLSLVRFVDYCEADYMDHAKCYYYDTYSRLGEQEVRHEYMHRSTKLPNGDIDGKVEYIDERNYRTCIYANGTQVGSELIYSYRTYNSDDKESDDKEGREERVPRWSCIKSYTCMRDFHYDFRNWKDIDMSKMKLMNRTDMETEELERNRYGFVLPREGEFMNILYGKYSMDKISLRSTTVSAGRRKRYIGNKLVDQWLRCTNPTNSHIGKEHHIPIVNGKITGKWSCGKQFNPRAPKIKQSNPRDCVYRNLRNHRVCRK